MSQDFLVQKFRLTNRQIADACTILMERISGLNDCEERDNLRAVVDALQDVALSSRA